jgi:hypothetical protein
MPTTERRGERARAGCHPGPEAMQMQRARTLLVTGAWRVEARSRSTPRMPPEMQASLAAATALARAERSSSEAPASDRHP